jgi:hypothetical protein
VRLLRSLLKKSARNRLLTLPKLSKLSQTGKRKASSASQPKNKRQKRSGGSAASLPVSEPAPALPPRVTTRSRNVRPPSKFR